MTRRDELEDPFYDEGNPSVASESAKSITIVVVLTVVITLLLRCSALFAHGLSS